MPAPTRMEVVFMLGYLVVQSVFRSSRYYVFFPENEANNVRARYRGTFSDSDVVATLVVEILCIQ